MKLLSSHEALVIWIFVRIFEDFGDSAEAGGTLDSAESGGTLCWAEPGEPSGAAHVALPLR